MDKAAHQAFFYRSPNNEDASGTQTYILTGVTRRMQDRSEWVAFPLHLVNAEHRVKYDLNASLSFGQAYQTDYSIEEFLQFYQNLAADYSCLPDSSIAVVDENSFVIQGRFTSVQQGVRFTFQPNGNGWEFVMTRCEAG